MKESSYISLGALMKAARKFKKLNQADVAKAIGCSQSALSKMEHDLLVPSAPQWFQFARYTSIPPESLESGIINRGSIVKFNNDQVSLGFKIPKRYRTARSEKVREIYPFLHFLENKVRPSMNKEFILSTGLDEEFFLDFDNLINYQLFVDTVLFLMKIGHARKEDIQEIVAFGQNEVYWNHLGSYLEKIDSLEELLKEYAKCQVFFQTDFQIKIENQSGKITLSYFPEYHLKQLSSNLSFEVIEFINKYREESVKNFIRKYLKKDISLELITESSSNVLGARFEVRAAA